MRKVIATKLTFDNESRTVTRYIQTEDGEWFEYYTKPIKDFQNIRIEMPVWAMAGIAFPTVMFLAYMIPHWLTVAFAR